MTDILQDFPIAAPASKVFAAVATPAGLDEWWTMSSAGTPSLGSEYALDFGPDYQWKARVVGCVPDKEFELELTVAMPDWMRTRVGFRLEDRGRDTWVRFSHRGWPAADEHYRISSHCWALYLRILRRYLEHGERVPYADRLSA
jgi:uncharacterized protein YndB with AHSA1/START domain